MQAKIGGESLGRHGEGEDATMKMCFLIPQATRPFAFSSDAEDRQTAWLWERKDKLREMGSVFLSGLPQQQPWCFFSSIGKAWWKYGAAQRAAAELRGWERTLDDGNAMLGSLTISRIWKKIGVEVVVFPWEIFFFR